MAKDIFERLSSRRPPPPEEPIKQPRAGEKTQKSF